MRFLRYPHDSGASPMHPGLLRYHSGPRIQSGSGFGPFLSGLFRELTPYASKAASSALSGLTKVATSKATKALGKELLKDGEHAKQVVDQKVRKAKRDLARALKSSVRDVHDDNDSRTLLKHQRATAPKKLRRNYQDEKWSNEPILKRPRFATKRTKFRQ